MKTTTIKVLVWLVGLSFPHARIDVLLYVRFHQRSESRAFRLLPTISDATPTKGWLQCTWRESQSFSATKIAIIRLSFVVMVGGLLPVRCSNCGICCERTEMELSSEDVERLEGAGYRQRSLQL